MSTHTQRNLGAWAATGATLTAILSSACCWVPLLLLALGASATGLSASFEAFRVPFLLVAALLLASGFYLVYVRKPACGPGGTCSAPNQKLTRLNRGILWLATLLVGAFAFFPNYVGVLLGSSGSHDTDGPTIRLRIEGMTCEACARGIEAELRAVSGVLDARVMYGEESAAIVVIPSKPPHEAGEEAYDDAVAEFGSGAQTTPATNHEASLAEGPSPHSTLHSLEDSLTPLRARFNDSKGKLRFITLLSPT